MTMKLFWAGLICGAGYVVGRPEGRAKLAELSKRPEVTQLRQRAASTVSSGAKTGQQQLAHAAHAAHAVKDKASEKLPGKTASGSDVVTAPAGARRGLRLPSFPRRGGRPDTSTMPAAGPVETALGTATTGTPPSSSSVNAVPATPLAASPDAPDEPS